jgi:hypothetical protein
MYGILLALPVSVVCRCLFEFAVCFRTPEASVTSREPESRFACCSDDSDRSRSDSRNSIGKGYVVGRREIDAATVVLSPAFYYIYVQTADDCRLIVGSAPKVIDSLLFLSVILRSSARVVANTTANGRRPPVYRASPFDIWARPSVCVQTFPDRTDRSDDPAVTPHAGR